jgi:SAM-dependent methyltransferase
LAVGDDRSYGTSTGSTRGAYQVDFEATLATSSAPRRGSDRGGARRGANPNLAGHDRVQSGELDLLLIDISQQELDKAPSIGRKLCVDVAGPDIPLVGSVDLACSQMLAEHVADGSQFLRNIAKMLKPGGLYLQVSPVLYTVPFAVNRVIPEGLSSVLLDVFQPRDHYQHAKFPARYSLCRGPATKHIARLEQSGLRVVAARGYYGHNYYGRIPGLRDLESLKSRYLAARPMPLFCSFGVYLFTRP